VLVARFAESFMHVGRAREAFDGELKACLRGCASNL
jgi:hypothetical protein